MTGMTFGKKVGAGPRSLDTMAETWLNKADKPCGGTQIMAKICEFLTIGEASA